MDDKAVAEYLGLTPEQVRLIREMPRACPSCSAIHPTYPQIKMFHHPGCKDQRTCRICRKEMPDWERGHEVGVICQACYGDDVND